MNITQTAKGDLLATIQINLVKADYEEDVNKTLKNYQHKTTMPGFRQGKVPLNMIKKMYGQTVLMEKLNKKVSEALNNYLNDNKLDIIGYPLPDPNKEQTVNPENQEEINFYFEVAFKPVINLNLKDYQINDYNIKASEDDIDKTIKNIQDNNKVDDKPAELNEDLFNKIFPNQEVKNIDNFRSKIAVEMEKQYKIESERMFYNKAIDKLVEEVKFVMPDNFLKRWIVENSKGKITAEDVEKDYDNTYSKSFKWQIIEEIIIKQNPDLIIKEEETRNFVRESYFKHIDTEKMDDDTKKKLNEIIDTILKDEEQNRNINNQLIENKLTAYLKKNMNVSVINIDYDGFVKALMPKVEYNEDKIQKTEDNAKGMETKEIKIQKDTQKIPEEKTE